MILISILTLGIVLLAFASQYFREDKFSLLTQNAKHAVEITVKNYSNNDYNYIDSNAVLTGYSILSTAIDADIYLVDMSGKTVVCTDEENGNHSTYLVSKDILDKAKNEGIYKELGKMGGIYSEQYFTVGIPIIINNNAIAGVVFVSTSAAALFTFLVEILKMFLFSALGVIIVSFIIIYFVTSNMVRPLREMVNAAQCFAKGDFSVRVPVDDLDEIGKLAMAFNNMASSMAAFESVRRSFVANVSHELKTPMTTIAGFIDGILDGTIPPEKQSHYLQIVSDEVKRLSRLVRSMLNIARIEAGEMSISKTQFDINDIVCQTIFTFEQSIEAKHLEVRGLDVDKVMVDADKDLMHQVVYNLMENAVKFVNDGGYIEVNYNNDGKMIFVGIKNSGDGIPKEEIRRVFDRFYKSDKSRSQDKNGVGLGLHIVRSIINLHGGEIIVRSVEGEYCEFVFSVPAAVIKNTGSFFRKQPPAQKGGNLPENAGKEKE